MANEPVVIQDYVSPIDNTRSYLQTEEKGKIKGSHGFIFNNFKTERQRIEEYLNNREKERNTTILNHLGIDINKPIDSDRGPIKKRTSFLQPAMKFKARTDLERIWDQVEKNRGATIDRNVVKKQLSKLELTKIKTGSNANEKSNNDASDTSSVEGLSAYGGNDSSTSREKNQKRKPSLFDSLRFMEPSDREPNNLFTFSQNSLNLFKDKPDTYRTSREKSFIKFFKRRQVDNSQAKELLKDLYNKTHFKAATDLALYSNIIIYDRNGG